MGTPLRISDDLVLRARIEAETSDRSLTAQVEHWVKLGIALEGILGHRQATELVRKGLSTSLEKALESAESSHGRELALARLESLGHPRYGVHPDHPGKLVRIDPDGGRTVGRFVNRTFVPDEGKPG